MLEQIENQQHRLSVFWLSNVPELDTVVRSNIERALHHLDQAVERQKVIAVQNDAFAERKQLLGI